MRTFSKLISILTHPIFIIIYSFFIYFKMDTFFNQMLETAAPKAYWILLSFLIMMVVFFPFISLFIMSKNKIISSYSLIKRKERLPVLFFMITYYLMTYYIFRHWNETLYNLLNPYVSFLFATLILLVLLFLITTIWKISLHSSSIAGLCGGIMAEIVAINEVYNTNTIMIITTLLLILIGLVGFARIYLKAHTFLQVIAGISLGFSVMFVVVYFQWKI